MKYRAEIDGLRALAVSTVVVFHFFPGILSLGYLGVDVFFVISGYLITLQLIGSRSQGYTHTLKRFYERRLKRLFPALFVFLAITSLSLSAILLTNDLERYLDSLIATQTFWANWFFWRDGGYFGGDDQLKPLLHMWSLSVEEQFYLIYPTIVLLLLAANSTRASVLVIGISIATLISLSGWAYLNHIGGQNPAFFLLPTRAWQFGFGALAALAHSSNAYPKMTKSSVTQALSATVIMIGFIAPLSHAMNTFIVTLGAAFFIVSKIDADSVTQRLFASRIATGIGKISYSLYLYHWPVAVALLYTSVKTPDFYLSVIGVIASVFMAILSFKFIEIPFRYKLKFRNTLFLMLSTSLISLMGVVLFISKGGDQIESQWAKASGTHNRCAPTSYILFGASRACLIGDDQSETRNVALIGNSHAQMYAPLVDAALQHRGEGGFLVPLAGCLPVTTVNISSECLEKAKANLKVIVEDDSIKTVLIASTWYADEYLDENRRTVGTDALVDAVDDLIEKLVTAEKEVALFSPIQLPDSDIASELPRLVRFGYVSMHEAEQRLNTPRVGYDSRFASINAHFQARLKDRYIKVYEDLCSETLCYFGAGDRLFFADSNHISKYSLDRLVKTNTQIANVLYHDAK